MTTFNVVRFRVKEGRDEEFLAAHRDGKARWPGMIAGHIIKTDERSYCLIGEWADAAAIKGARPEMIATLNSFRDTLDDLGNGLGVTDAVSGDTVVDLTA
jgi:quinol monooxygenase YgiN